MARAFDAVQRDRVPEGVPLGAFVRGIARHVIADTLRRRARTAGASLARALSVPTADLSVLDLIISDERARLVRDALGRLSRADRELLERSLLDGESLVDIARRSGVQPERVRKRKSRAMERLLEIIRPDACHASDQFNDNGS